MKRQISVGELLVACITLFLSGIAAFVQVKQNISTLEIRTAQLESSYREINGKLDKLQELNTAILVNLEKKQDRK